MRTPISTTAKKIWKMMKSKATRDSYVAAHISNTVASQILMLREAKGWTQTVLADKCGMRQSRISTLEDPNYENFEASTLRRIASAFDVALTIRFIPFSELTGWMATLSPERLTPADFAHDTLPARSPVGVPALAGEQMGHLHDQIQGVQQTTAAAAMAQLKRWEVWSGVQLSRGGETFDPKLDRPGFDEAASTASQAMASAETGAALIREAEVIYHPRPSLVLASSIQW